MSEARRSASDGIFLGCLAAAAAAWSAFLWKSLLSVGLGEIAIDNMQYSRNICQQLYFIRSAFPVDSGSVRPLRLAEPVFFHIAGITDNWV